MTHLPNFLSVFRIFCSLTLPFAAGNPLIYFMFCLLGGISDLFDGWLARKLHVTSALGARLDSLGDFTFIIVNLGILFWQPSFFLPHYLIWLIVLVFIVRIINLLITRIKFQQWRVMRTIGNRLSGFLLFTSLPAIVLFAAHVTSFPWSVIAVICLAAALEETWLLLNSKMYQPDRSSIFGKSAKNE